LRLRHLPCWRDTAAGGPRGCRWSFVCYDSSSNGKRACCLRGRAHCCWIRLTRNRNSLRSFQSLLHGRCWLRLRYFQLRWPVHALWKPGNRRRRSSGCPGRHRPRQPASFAIFHGPSVPRAAAQHAQPARRATQSPGIFPWNLAGKPDISICCLSPSFSPLLLLWMSMRRDRRPLARNRK
jgi:hypothetical protein